MSEAKAQEAGVPTLVSYLKPGDGSPYLAGSKCGSCGHVFVGEREICAKCTARGNMKPVHLAETGTLYSYTIIYRSFPGIDTPFVDAIVDLDDGAHLKGTLLGVTPEPDRIDFGLPVRVIYREVEPPGAKGQKYLNYYFVPAAGYDEGENQ